jgi:hypothetical protein
MPGPEPALRKLDRSIGTWEMKGRTLDSDVDNMTARTTFEWRPGGHFLVQRFAADFMGMDIQSLEVIAFDPTTGTYPSTVYANLSPVPLPYRWQIDGDELTIRAEAAGATFRGRWNEDGSVFPGGWRPIPATMVIPAMSPTTSRAAGRSSPDPATPPTASGALDDPLRRVETGHLAVHRLLHGSRHQELLETAEVGRQREADLRAAPGRRESEVAAWSDRPATTWKDYRAGGSFAVIAMSAPRPRPPGPLMT